MWLGLLYCIPDDAPADGERAMVILYTWEAGRERPFTVGCPLSAAPDMARMLREAGARAPILTPQCDACGVALDLPLD
jgi:hypothetical protein